LSNVSDVKDDVRVEHKKHPGLLLCQWFSWVVFCRFSIGSEDFKSLHVKIYLLGRFDPLSYLFNTGDLVSVIARMLSFDGLEDNMHVFHIASSFHQVCTRRLACFLRLS